MNRIAPFSGLAFVLGMLALVGCTHAVEASPGEPADLPATADEHAALDTAIRPGAWIADKGAGWGSAAVCNAGAQTLAECCDLGGGSGCYSIAEYARCCGDKSCADGKLIACLAAYIPSKSDRCLGALSACNKM